MGTWEQAHDSAERAQLRCPVCGAGPDRPFSPFSLQFDTEGLIFRSHEGDERWTYERLWRFGPCGCEGREILPEATVTY